MEQNQGPRGLLIASVLVWISLVSVVTWVFESSCDDYGFSDAYPAQTALYLILFISVLSVVVLWIIDKKSINLGRYYYWTAMSGMTVAGLQVLTFIFTGILIPTRGLVTLNAAPSLFVCSTVIWPTLLVLPLFVLMRYLTRGKNNFVAIIAFGVILPLFLLLTTYLYEQWRWQPVDFVDFPAVIETQ